MVTDELLRRDVRFLGDMLGEVIVELAGSGAFDLVEQIRMLARDRRAGKHGAEPALAERIETLDAPQARVVAQAFSIFFDLANIAEDRQRDRALDSAVRAFQVTGSLSFASAPRAVRELEVERVVEE